MPETKSDDNLRTRGGLAFWSKSMSRYLRKARHDAGMSLRELQERSGVSHAEIFRIEDGQQDCRLTSLADICAALGIPAGHILDDFFMDDWSRHVPAVTSDPAFNDLAKSLAADMEDQRRVLADNMAVCSSLTTNLLRCSCATRKAKRIQYPDENIKAGFLHFADALDKSEDNLDRLGCLKELEDRPLSELRRHNLIFDSFWRKVMLDLRGTPSKAKQKRITHLQNTLGIGCVWGPLTPP